MRRRYQDLTGRRSGRLTVVRLHDDSDTEATWQCACECGGVTIQPGRYIRNVAVMSCGCMKTKGAESRRKDMTGMTFGRLTVMALCATLAESVGARWTCFCLCGTTTVVLGQSLRNGATKSCGCLRGDVARATAPIKTSTHGHARTSGHSPEYSRWRSMIRRCENPNQADYPRYGGRGISVWPEWRTDFTAFFLHLGPLPSPKHTLDRFPDQNGNYEPGNVRWATQTEQQNNRRNNRMVTAFGRTMTLAQWAAETGVTASRLWKRLDRGVHPDIAVVP